MSKLQKREYHQYGIVSATCLVEATIIHIQENKNIENVMLVGLAIIKPAKKHTNKCKDGSTYYRIKVTKTSAHIQRHYSLGYLDSTTVVINDKKGRALLEQP